MELLKFINIPFVSLLALIPSAVASLVCSGNPLLFLEKPFDYAQGDKQERLKRKAGIWIADKSRTIRF
jgi:hypothetical protein